MTETTGIVIDIKDGTAYVMTKACDIVRTKATAAMCPGMSVHLQLQPVDKLLSNHFPVGTSLPCHRARSKAHEQSRPRAIKWAIAVCLAIALIFIPTIGFLNPVYAWVSLDINPSIEFAINNSLLVVRATGLNTDAQEMMRNTEFTGLTLDHSIRLALELAVSAGYEFGDAKHPIVIDATLQRMQSRYAINQSTTSDGLSALLENMKTQFEADSINAFVRMESSPLREEAHRLGLSIGRYAMMEMAKRTGAALTTEESRNMRLADLARLAGMRLDNSNMTDEKEQPESKMNPSIDIQNRKDATEQIQDSATATTNGGIAVPSDRNQEQSAAEHQNQIETSNTVMKPLQEADNEEPAETHAQNQMSQSSTGSAIVTRDENSGSSTQNPSSATDTQGSFTPENIPAFGTDSRNGDAQNPQISTTASATSPPCTGSVDPVGPSGNSSSGGTDVPGSSGPATNSGPSNGNGNLEKGGK